MRAHEKQKSNTLSLAFEFAFGLALSTFHFTTWHPENCSHKQTEKGQTMKLIFYFYLSISVAALIYAYFYWMRQDDRYDKNLAAYMKGELADYFEVSYLKKEHLLFILMSAPLGLICVHVLISDVDTSSPNWWGLLIIALLLFAAPTINYFRKSREKIVYDHGQITHYVGDKIKVSGSIYDVDRAKSYLYQVGEGASVASSFIMFYSGDGILFQRKSMDEGYKLEALIRKKDLWINPALEALKELRSEFGEDEDLAALEKLVKGDDQK